MDHNWPSESDEIDFVTRLDDIQFEWEEEQVTNDGELEMPNIFIFDSHRQLQWLPPAVLLWEQIQ